MGMGDSNELFEMQQLDENKAKMENKQFEEIAQNPESLQALQQYSIQQQQFEEQAQAMQAQGVDPMQAGMQPPQLPLATPQVRDFMTMKCMYIFIMHSENQAYTMNYRLKCNS